MIRGIGLRGAVAVNVITMIGIGPLITIPLVLAQLAGSLALIGWIAGAFVALCDGLVWAELGSRFPGAGGTYVYLRETFGRDRWGRLFAFLFNWQFMLFAPLLLASGYIGFSNYAQYFWPNLSWIHIHAIAAGIGILTTLALLRPIRNISHISQFLGVAAIATLLAVIVAALPHMNMHRAFAIPAGSQFGLGFLAGLGGALYITLYDYAGYGDAALLGEEVRNPHKTIPLAIVISISIVALLYFTLQTAVLGSTPWQTLAAKGGDIPAAGQYVASTIVEQSWGRAGGIIVTLLVLVTAFASVYGNLLGYSRIPFAAARDGVFFEVFDRLHPKYQYPYVSLLVIGALSLIASLFTLDTVIALLSAGAILIQSVAQIVALGVLRARGEPAPFRMWLFPLPAIIALVGWVYAFFATGTQAIVLGVGWLVLGVAAFFALAWYRKLWPFAAMLLLLAFPSHASATTWNAGAVRQQNGIPVFTVDGKPFFVYGASFFYERIPRGEWRRFLLAYKRLGINTIDLYVPWNWHELRDGDFDFTGRTNDRRDLNGLLREIDSEGYKIVLRPGPVIRNEWRNGGYPAWLLTRPEYRMPLHDVLEGRYPATATLQNAHSDDAAAEWMQNATHMKYAARWLRTVLSVVKPFHRDVIAIALDDDQGAYIDNQTWPAPHFQAYLRYLRDVVRGETGKQLPVFINTYQMKVTASAPVWAWGNWYQSDAYAIGDHDRTQLEFSTALLQTQPQLPVMVSEFQAGWLQNADEAAPRPADPSNTTLALHTMLQMGAHGVVNFPVQDTLNPPGWEAPWANALYAWDAAYHVDVPRRQGRWAPTADFGTQMTALGSELAATRADAHVAIAWLPDAYAKTADNAAVYAAANVVQEQQRNCRKHRITCALLDLEASKAADFDRFSQIIVPDDRSRLRTDVRAKLSAFARHGGIVSRTLDAQSSRYGLPYDDATLLTDGGRRVFLDIVNYGKTARKYRPTTLIRGSRIFSLPAITVPARDAVLLPLQFSGNGVGLALDSIVTSTCRIAATTQMPDGTSELDVRTAGSASCTLGEQSGRTASAVTVNAPGARLAVRGGKLVILDRAPSIASGSSTGCFPSKELHLTDEGRSLCVNAFAAETPGVYGDRDLFQSGFHDVVLHSRSMALAISPAAGARSFAFFRTANFVDAFSTVGGLRDDVTSPLGISARDYIGKYTHPIPAGTFNRAYAVNVLRATGNAPAAEFTYDAPDVPPSGVRFERIVSVDSALDAFDVDSLVSFHGSGTATYQQHVMRSSFAMPATVIAVSNGYGFWNGAHRQVAMVAWKTRDVTAHANEAHPGNDIVALTFARGGWRRSAYAIRGASSLGAASAELRRFAQAVEREQGRGGSGANRR